MYVQFINNSIYLPFMAKKSRLEIRLNDETKALLKKLAEESRRSMSDYFRILLEYVDKNKIKPN